MFYKIHDGEHATRPIDIESVKRHAKRIASWTNLTTSESQELIARIYGATNWQNFLKLTAFSSDEDLKATFGVAFEERKEFQVSLLMQNLHINEPTANQILNYWQPTSVQAVPSTREPDLDGLTFQPQSVFWTLLQCVGTNQAIPADCVLVVVNNDALDDQTIAVGIVRNDRLSRYIASDDIYFLDLQACGTKSLSNAFVKLTEEQTPKRLLALGNAFAKAGSISLPVDFVKPNAMAPSTRITASWLLQPRSDADIAKLFSEWKPWNRQDNLGMSKDKNSFHCMNHRGFRFELKALTYIYVCVYKELDRYPHAEIQMGVGGIGFKDTIEREFRVNTSGYYLMKYSNQPRGLPLTGFTEDDAYYVCNEVGLEFCNYGFVPNRSFFESPAGFAFAQWIATEKTVGHRILKHGHAESYLGDWVAPAIERMRWELVRAKII